ncbi:hypothetical protein HMI56_007237 [Coelomomyces lativittatus]|nr:hypothetical protein HMI56_007237 [Coelomomyces lativittatus]
MLLFLGPLVQMALNKELFWQDRIVFELFLHRISTVSGQRNFLLGPLLEEFVFRACLLLPFLFTRLSWPSLVFFSPFFFGLAHLHHIFDHYVHNGRTLYALKRGISNSVFQCGYSTIFGWIACFLYLRTGHLVAPVLAHIFCNIMGLPDVKSIPYSNAPKLIYFSYFVGFLSFLSLLGPLTSPPLFRSHLLNPSSANSPF